MTTNNFLLSFEVSKDGDELNIHCDEVGLDNFILILSQMREKISHENLMTPSWGGSELSENPQSKDDHLLNKVTIHKW